MSQLSSAARGLGRVLTDGEPLWRPRPFMDPAVGWRETHPGAYHWLLGLETEQIDIIDRTMAWPEDAPDDLKELGRCLSEAVEDLSLALPATPINASRRMLWRIPGRKWAQIHRFAAVAGGLVERSTPHVAEVVDWCAGKGHLGRLIAHTCGVPVVHIEQRKDLCRVGAELAERARMNHTTRFVVADVLSDRAPLELLNPESLAVGLHACGGLSTRLVQAASQRHVSAIMVATCCYHKLAPHHDHYHPLSGIGQAAGLQLDRRALRLPTADEGQVGRTRKERRRRELAWRQGLQLLVATATGDSTYVPLGALPRSHLNKPFEQFCRDVAQMMQLPLPPSWSPQRAEAAGWERARRARALALVRGMYRRPMEAWLIADQALVFEELGYYVQVGAFCDRRITPRNLAFVAWRR